MTWIDRLLLGVFIVCFALALTGLGTWIIAGFERRAQRRERP